MSLEPITPTDTVELYIKDKQRDSADTTVRSHRSRLGHFLHLDAFLSLFVVMVHPLNACGTMPLI